MPLEIVDDWDDLDDEERAELHAWLRESIEQMNAGQPFHSSKRSPS